MILRLLATAFARRRFYAQESEAASISAQVDPQRVPKGLNPFASANPFEATRSIPAEPCERSALFHRSLRIRPLPAMSQA